ncbi:ABC transporter, permease protein [Treponema primitia ZAS-2]|uniref:ABC transporter, permease protein n=1 Tax=Treponema primitia (strain ATCC BAA-887 / DSM 12427 / ZAS-2) TaxID=545694 RepID=F5YNJ6_TREPZ|nr:carbohydrate ABC transporter permease [Treponema primitia]AEF85787.1 ABC transporter, permease protein [Treponema primitia ZAS-2]
MKYKMAAKSVVIWEKIATVFKHIFLIVVALMSIFPFFWMIIGATNETREITKGVLIPGTNFLKNLTGLQQTGNIFHSIINTAVITLFQVFFSLLICSMAGYGFTKYPNRIRSRLFSVFLLTMMIPFAAIMIPLFTMMSSFNLIDTKISVIIASLSNTFLIFFFRQSFKSFPTEIIEAARIDGAGEFYTYFRIVIPAMRSTFAAALIYAFMKEWNNYQWPLLTLQSTGSKTLTLFISNLSSAYYVDYGQIMAAVLIATIPTIIVFMTMQKQFVAGIIGSVKG